MEIVKNLDGKKLTVKLVGRLDTITAQPLEKELDGALSDIEELVYDFEDLEYISSAGLRVLLACQKEMSKHGSMVVEHANNDIKEVFEITGFSEILTIR